MCLRWSSPGNTSAAVAFFAVAVIVVNIAIGTYQEGKAEAATKAIKSMVSAKARAQRNGRTNEVDSSQLVPGDVISLASGDRIPADVRWLTTSNLQVTEAALTGESTPISKNTEPVRADATLGDRSCMGFSGTLVFTGQGDAVVVATGDNAQIGTINKLMANVEVAKTPLLQQVHVVSWRLLYAVAGVAGMTYPVVDVGGACYCCTYSPSLKL